MSATVATLLAGALIGSGLLAGTLFGVAVGVVPAFAAVPAPDYVRIHRVVGAGFDRVMPFIVLLTSTADVAAGLALGGPARVLLLLAALLQAGVAVTSQLGNVPINRRVRSLPAGTLPPGWADPRPAWRRWHLLRTALACTALVAHALAALSLS
ncbi:anthrone oxygenase family protein [Actinoplanes sp. TFC3]|uniref:anthrone oxygenase family protein n=1 Tax=Actinoplanes sp. TFC3 TaxID=1710355 RepID=UPI0008359D1B|nr:anthrone oxygenase family protein [Actinoplanes sp. TFC3]